LALQQFCVASNKALYSNHIQLLSAICQLSSGSITGLKSGENTFIYRVFSRPGGAANCPYAKLSVDLRYGEAEDSLMRRERK